MGSGGALARAGVRGVWVFAVAVLLFTASSPNLHASEQAADKARAAAAAGDYASAERHCREGLEADSRDPRLWNTLGIALNRQSRFAEAAEAFKQAASLSPGVAGLQLNIGIALYRAGKFAGAADALEKVRDLEQARELLATTYVALEQYDRALPILEPLAESSTDPAIHIALASCYERLGRKADVEKAMAHMLKIVPDNAALHVALAQAYDRETNTERAVAEFRRAVDMDPNVASVRFELGRVLWKAHRFEEAEPEFTAALKLDRSAADANYYLGTSYLYRDQPSRAIPFLKQFADDRPGEKKAFFELGRALLMDGKAAQAIAPLEKAIAMSPEEAGMHFVLGQAYRNAGRLQDAQREFQRTKELGVQKSSINETSSLQEVGVSKH
jgi:superkiller protein 3